MGKGGLGCHLFLLLAHVLGSAGAGRAGQGTSRWGRELAGGAGQARLGWWGPQAEREKRGREELGLELGLERWEARLGFV